MAGRSTRALDGMKTNGASLSISQRALYGWLIPLCAYWVLLVIAWQGSGGPNESYPRPHGLFIVAALGGSVLNLWVLAMRSPSIFWTIVRGVAVPGLLFSMFFRV